MAQVLGDGLGHAFVPKQGGFVHALVGLFGKAAMAGAELRHHDLAIRGLVRRTSSRICQRSISGSFRACNRPSFATRRTSGFGGFRASTGKWWERAKSMSGA